MMKLPLIVVLCCTFVIAGFVQAQEIRPTANGIQQNRERFAKWDTDGNQRLTRDELPANLRGNFDRADADLDGTISLEEHLSFLQLTKRIRQERNFIPAGVTSHTELAYVEDGHPRHRLDLYLPAKMGDKPVPLVVWIHGGGWQQGSKDLISRQAFLLENGFAVASINYRLTSHAPFPAQIHDCKAAIRYLRTHAGKYGINPDTIGVFGSSAGGHLAALLGTTGGMAELEGVLGETDVSSRVQAVCDWFGPTDLVRMVTHPTASRQGEEKSTTTPEAKLVGGLVLENMDNARLASPATHVSADDPPFLIMHGTEDVLVPTEQSVRFHQQLSEAGVPSELVVVAGAGHGFFKEPEHHQRVVDFFAKHLQTTVKAQAGAARTAADKAAPEGSEWIQLFNGKDLTGWIAKIRGHDLGDNYADTFRVTDGLLVVSYDKYQSADLVNMDGKQKTTFDKFGHLFYNEAFSHYILRVEYRFVGEQIENGPQWAIRNNGIMIHGQDPATMDKLQKFPVSIEVQLLGGNGTDDRSTLNVCSPGTHIVVDGKLIVPHITNSSSATYHGDQWVTAEVEVHGNELIRHKIDGKTVLEYSHPQLDPRSPEAVPFIVDGNVMLSGGSISLQSESHPTEFRKIELKKLSPDPNTDVNVAGNRFVSNWALAMPDGSAGWLSLVEKEETLQGELWTVGSPKPLTDVSIVENQLHFTHRRAVGDREYEGGPPTGKKIPCRHVASVDGDVMQVVMDRPVADGIEKVKFGGQRIAPLPSQPDLSNVKWGEPIELFNGRDLTGWRLTNSGQTNCWKAVEGVLVNDTPKQTFDPYARYGNLRTDREFTDFNLAIDFKVPPAGNSGIYLRGLYEVQVVDRDSKMQGIHGVGAIFNRIAPSAMVGKPGDEWQHYDITLVDRHVTVILNGAKVIDNEPIVGCTNGALQADDSLPGPIYLQGDHTSVSYRNIVLRPVVDGQ